MLSWFQRIRLRLRSLFDRNKVERELNEEMQYHFDREVERRVEQGLTPDQARSAARRAMGQVAQSMEECRDMRRVGFIEDLFRDFRFAARSLRKRPSPTLISLATLALGIGVATAAFSVANAVLLKPLPYAEPERLVMAWNTNVSEGRTLERQRIVSRSMTPAEFLDWRDRSEIFEHMVAFQSWYGMIGNDESPEQFFGYRVSEGFFDLLGVEPLLGRGFTKEEESLGGPRAIVLQHDFWRRRFNSDPSVIGTELQLRDGPVRIVGVMPRDFFFFSRQIEAVFPLAFSGSDLRLPRERRYLRVVGRLQDGLSLEQAQERTNVFATRLAQEYPEAQAGWSPELVRLAENSAGELMPAMRALLGAVFCVLLIMCANLANLLLVQASSRAQELALRSALGAGRWTIVRQMLAESLLLSAVGSTLGLGIAYGLVSFFQNWLPDRYTWGTSLVQAEAIQVDSAVLAFAVVAGIVSGLLFGLLPALHATGGAFRRSLTDVSRGAVGGRRGQATRNWLVIGEVALAVVMVFSAALLVRSFWTLYSHGAGIHSSGVLSMQVTMPSRIDDQAADESLSAEEASRMRVAARRSFEESLTAEIGKIPGIREVTVASERLMTGWYLLFGVEAEGAPGGNSDVVEVVRSYVQPNYFDLIGIPLLRGRAIEATDQPNTPPVAVINQQAARELFGSDDVVGKRIRFSPRAGRQPDPWVEIVGVAGDVHEDGPHNPAKPYFYLSKQQAERYGGGWYYMAADGDPYRLLPAIERAARAVAPGTIIYRPRSLDDLKRDSTWKLNYATVLLGGLAALALLLAALGVYGVLAYSVGERRREIGLRMAVGAQRGDVLSHFLKQGVRLIAWGLVAGAGVAVGFARLLESLLYGVDSSDVLTLLVVGVVLAAAGVFASLGPAIRATRVAPMQALRIE